MKELEDYSFFPAVLRNYQTEFIGFLVARFNAYDGFIQYIKTLSMAPLPAYDLCSGSGEPATNIFRKSTVFTYLTLSDKYPNPSRYPGERIFYETLKKDVLDMEFNKDVCYTMYNSFHHFSDPEKKLIIQKIRAAGGTAFFVEILEPNVLCLLKVMLLTTAGTLIFTPFVRPFSLKRFLLTYIIPVNIFTIAFDGVVSVFKSYSAEHYKELFASFGNSVQVHRIDSFLSPLIIIHTQTR